MTQFTFRKMDDTTKQKTGSSRREVSIKKQKRIFKIIVIGDSNVGKTCLTFRFCGGLFPMKTEATIGVDFRERIVEIEGEELKLQLWDTAGQERFRKSMVQHYYRNVHAVVFVYDVTKIVSFESLSHWIEECDQYQLTTTIPRVIVGNKCDCTDSISVNTNMAQKFADLHNMPLFETSAKDDSEADHVEAIFMTIAHKLKNSKPMMSPLLHKQGTLDGTVSQSSGVISVGKSHAREAKKSNSVDENELWCAC
ncbi:putative Ras-related protein Rab-33 isoform X2 [Limulus polyphemus]|uniref:Ras-related protein Rab-33 isoform X2 n=1 Tax=Limulus polyphemus TaxID=6850 RepID=A0ABM1SM33_LIMPO|nr:putative Ras-related protein Rab-33 isoform X2 [Limulus polyphemus]